MTVRIPRLILYVVGTGIFLGVAVGGYVIFRAPEKDCLTAAGSPVTCATPDAMTPSEFDLMKEQEDAAEKAQAAAEECQRQTGGLQRALEEVNSRLSVGLAYDEYSTQVGNARVAYDRVPIGKLDPECLLEVGVHLEDAMNAYVKADDAWNGCIVDFGCATDSIDPELQRRWAQATVSIRKAKAGVASIREAEVDPPSGLATE